MKYVKNLLVVIAMVTILFCAGSVLAADNTLTLPQAIQIIEQEAFYGDTSIDKVVLPEGITEIRARAFAGSTLTEINLPGSLTFIAEDAFDGPEKVSLNANSGTYAFMWAINHGYIQTDNSKDYVFTYNSKENGYYVSGYKGTSEHLVLPTFTPEGDVVKGLVDKCFANNTNIKTVVIPGYFQIAQRAFYNCTSLETVEMQDGTIIVGWNCFEGCTSLRTVKFSNTISYMFEDLFSGCTNLKKLVYPISMFIKPDDRNWTQGWGYNHHSALQGSSVDTVVIPEGAVTIFRETFANATSLKHIYIPSSVGNIDPPSGNWGVSASAFAGIKNSVTIHGKAGSFIESYAKENGISFSSEPLPEVTLTVEQSGDSVGSSIQATAEAMNGTAPYTYQFSLYRDDVLIRQTSYSSNNEYGFRIYEAGTYQVAVNVKDYIGLTVSDYSGSFIISDVESPVISFSLHGEVCADDVPLNNTYVYAVNQTDQSVASTYTTSDGKWDLYNLKITDTYELKYYKDGYNIPGAGTVTVADASNHLIAKGSLVIDNDAMLQTPTFTMSASEMIVGESLTLTVYAPKAERVRLIVDGNAYEWYAVTNGACTIERRFTKAGTRQVQIQVGSMNSWGNVSEAQSLVITSAGTLTAPKISAQATASVGNEYGITWDAVEHATDYQLYLYCNGRRILPQYGKELTKITSTSYTIPGEYIACPGEYAIELIASGYNYSQCSGFAGFEAVNQIADASLSGKVVDSVSGDPIAGAEVSVYQIVGDHYDYITSCKTNSLGCWKASALYAGTRYYYVLGKDGYIIDYEEDLILNAGTNTMDVVKAVAIGDGPLYTYDSLVEANNEYSEHFLTIYSPGEWTASTTADWIALSSDGSRTVTQTVDNQTLSVYVAPNEGEERQDVIKVVCDNYNIEIIVSQHANDNITAFMLRGFKTTKNGTPVLSQGEAKDLLNFLAGHDVVTKGGFLWLFYNVDEGYDNYWNVITGNGKYSDEEEALYRQAFIQYAFMQVSAIANYEATNNELYRRALQYSLNYINDEYDDVNKAVRDVVIDETLDALGIDTLPDAEEAAFFVTAATANKIRAWVNGGRYMVKNWNAFDSFVSWSDEMLLDGYLTTYLDSGLYPSKSKLNKWIEYLEVLDSVD